jgi:hypothetical protein
MLGRGALLGGREERGMAGDEVSMVSEGGGGRRGEVEKDATRFNLVPAG